MKLLIIGCGISGIALSRKLRNRGIPFTIIDPCEYVSATFISGGLMNPITGRKYSLQWNIYVLLQTAYTFYKEIESYLQLEVMKQVEILKIHKSIVGLKEWEESKQNKKELSEFISDDFDHKNFREYFHCPEGGIVIKKALQVDTKKLIGEYQKKLTIENSLLIEEFSPFLLTISENEISYKNEAFTHLVFCDGIHALQNKFFNWIPFKPAKGECFILEIPELPQAKIYQKGIILIPLGEGIFWAGATNTWNDISTLPTQEGKNELADQLNQLLKIPYRILDHQAAIRPTIKDRNPVVGNHPLHKNMFILNGMGTKGMMLAPYYAEILLQHILTLSTIPSGANVLRFAQHLK